MTRSSAGRSRWTDEMLDELADSVSELRESVAAVKDSVSELRESVSEVKDSVDGVRITAQALLRQLSNNRKMKLGKQKWRKSGKDSKSPISVLRFCFQKSGI